MWRFFPLVEPALPRPAVSRGDRPVGWWLASAQSRWGSAPTPDPPFTSSATIKLAPCQVPVRSGVGLKNGIRRRNQGASSQVQVCDENRRRHRPPPSGDMQPQFLVRRSLDSIGRWSR